MVVFTDDVIGLPLTLSPLQGEDNVRSSVPLPKASGPMRREATVNAAASSAHSRITADSKWPWMPVTGSVSSGLTRRPCQVRSSCISWTFASALSTPAASM